jgi:hypothetical protein
MKGREPITVKEYLDPIEQIQYENVFIIWNIKHSFDEKTPNYTLVQGSFTVELSPLPREFPFENNFSGIAQFLNPFPNLLFTHHEQKYQILIPGNRIFSVSLEGTNINFTFIPHDSFPIIGFPLEKPVSWGTALLTTNEDQAVHLLKIFLKILYFRNELPRLRCETCRGLKFLKGPLPDEDEISNLDAVCFDCTRKANSFYHSIDKIINTLSTSQSLNGASDRLFPLIEEGISLAQSIPDDKLTNEFILFKAKILISTKDPTQQKQARRFLTQIAQFCGNQYPDLLQRALSLLQVIDEPIV